MEHVENEETKKLYELGKQLYYIIKQKIDLSEGI